jgi:sugar/nucleoside kinase (ribokinase family)
LNATDTLIRLPRFPEFNSKLQFDSAQVLPGGQTASAVVACQSWGLRTRYIGKVGDDFAADLQRRAFTAADVEAHLLSVPQCASQTAYILVDASSGERTILWRRDDRLALRPDELDRTLIVSARALLVDGHDNAAAAQAARWAHEAGLPVVADMDNLYPDVEPLLASVDYLIASHDFPARLTGEADLLQSLPLIAQRHGCRVAGATLGAEGALLCLQESGFLYAPAYQVDVCDTTGAGDIFHGAFAYGLLAGWSLPGILDFSCAAAALNCTALGARGGIRPLAEIERLRSHGQKRPPHPSFARYNIPEPR